MDEHWSAPIGSWQQRAQAAYEQAVFEADGEAITRGARHLDAVAADLALARGRLLHAEFLRSRVEDPRELAELEDAAERYAGLGDDRGRAEALFWVGTFHQVVRQDHAAALPSLELAHELAVAAGDRLTLSYVVRHLAFADLAAGRIESAGRRLDESVWLRREIGFQPGVAAAVLAQAAFAAEHGTPAGARQLLDEARTLAEACGATGVVGWVDEAADALGLG